MSDSPQVKFSDTILEFSDAKLGETLTKSISVSNAEPGTILEGSWEVAPHPSDPAQTPYAHAWISFSPDKFTSNVIECQVIVDASRLMADRTYERKIILRSNSAAKTHTLTVKVQTAIFSSSTPQLPYFSIALLLATSLTLTNMLVSSNNFTGAIALGWILFLAAITTFGVAMTETGALALALMFALVLILSLALAMSLYQAQSSWAFGWAIAGAILLAGAGAWNIVWESVKRRFSRTFAVALSILTILFGSSVGIWIKVGLNNMFITSSVLATGLLVITMTIYPPLKRARDIAKYLASEEYLIKP